LLPLLFVSNNLGHLLFARKLTPTVKTDRVLTQLCHSLTTEILQSEPLVETKISDIRSPLLVPRPALGSNDRSRFGPRNRA
jgi:hypothetical protein